MIYETARAIGRFRAECLTCWRDSRTILFPSLKDTASARVVFGRPPLANPNKRPDLHHPVGVIGGERSEARCVLE